MVVIRDVQVGQEYLYEAGEGPTYLKAKVCALSKDLSAVKVRIDTIIDQDPSWGRYNDGDVFWCSPLLLSTLPS